MVFEYVHSFVIQSLLLGLWENIGITALVYNMYVQCTHVSLEYDTIVKSCQGPFCR